MESQRSHSGVALRRCLGQQISTDTDNFADGDGQQHRLFEAHFRGNDDRGFFRCRIVSCRKDSPPS